MQLECGALKVQCEKESPYALIGNERYPLKPFLMRPYPQRSVGPDEEIFNKRLSLARQTVECAFGIISNKWRILLKAFEEMCIRDRYYTYNWTIRPSLFSVFKTYGMHFTNSLELTQQFLFLSLQQW